MISVEGQNRSTREVYAFAVDLHDGTPMSIEVVETVPQTRELLMNQPLLEVQDRLQAQVRFGYFQLQMFGGTRVREVVVQ
jgi:hypothetical protein